MTTIKEVIKQIRVKKQRLAVYERLVVDLEESLPTEGEKEAETGIDTEDGPVPESVINDVIDEITGEYVTPLKKELNELLERDVSDGEEKAAKEKSGTGRKKAGSGEGGGEGGQESPAGRTHAGGRRKAKGLQLKTN